MIPFNKPFFSGMETKYIIDAVESGHISGNGKFTKKCQAFFEQKFGIKKALLTSSCTDALEMCAILLDMQPGDEVIMPSYTFVSTANAFVLRGATIVFCDSRADHPGIDESKIEELITPKTRAIVPVHYAGVACDMDVIMDIANRYNIFVVEDAAQAIDSSYKGKPLGSIGHLAAFSFHETKNIISGEGGLLAVNDERFVKRSEIIWEKGTNRSAFWRGEVDKYGWVDVGSSFLPSELTAAFLWAQLESMNEIQNSRINVWNRYYEGLQELRDFGVVLPSLPSYATNNAHMFYFVCNTGNERSQILQYLKSNEIGAVFHYLSLHKSPYFEGLYSGNQLINSDKYTERLIRLPFYNNLDIYDQTKVIDTVINFYRNSIERI
ncbi:dTDP-4-amino-4,6-dideoxygalactose transaminase [Salibacteraceae bacterium]|nr:dTDP-4-amino-4,6-dideoxygalactose transaminase [Salibacteraceae bacterium]MDC1204079.1 dTDP-4-amino-4,6-dideoxygalactose transaminase [Salibacteraceae bacterium]